MTPEHITYLAVKDEISKLSESEQALINATAATLRDIITKTGPCGYMALALIGAEFADRETL